MTPPLIPMPLFFFTPSLYNSSRAFTMASLMVSPRDPAVVVKSLQNARLFDKYFMLKFINTAHSSLLRSSPYSLARASALPRALFAKSCLSALFAASQLPLLINGRSARRQTKAPAHASMADAFICLRLICDYIVNPNAFLYQHEADCRFHNVDHLAAQVEGHNRHARKTAEYKCQRYTYRPKVHTIK